MCGFCELVFRVIHGAKNSKRDFHVTNLIILGMGSKHTMMKLSIGTDVSEVESALVRTNED